MLNEAKGTSQAAFQPEWLVPTAGNRRPHCHIPLMSAKRNTPQHAAYFQTFSTHLYSLTHIHLRGAMKQTTPLANLTLNLIMLTPEENHHADMGLP